MGLIGLKVLQGSLCGPGGLVLIDFGLCLGCGHPKDFGHMLHQGHVLHIITQCANTLRGRCRSVRLREVLIL